MATINAVAIVTSVGINSSNFANYNINFLLGASDGTTNVGINGLAEVSFSVANPKKADVVIREAMSAALLSTNGWVIDPADIYIPFS